MGVDMVANGYEGAAATDAIFSIVHDRFGACLPACDRATLPRFHQSRLAVYTCTHIMQSGVHVSADNKVCIQFR